MDDADSHTRISPMQAQVRHEYAAELLRRYRELRRWAAENWPNRTQPLSQADFIASERELLQLVEARLHQGDEVCASSPATDQDGPSTPAA